MHFAKVDVSRDKLEELYTLTYLGEYMQNLAALIIIITDASKGGGIVIACGLVKMLAVLLAK